MSLPRSHAKCPRWRITVPYPHCSNSAFISAFASATASFTLYFVSHNSAFSVAIFPFVANSSNSSNLSSSDYFNFTSSVRLLRLPPKHHLVYLPNLCLLHRCLPYLSRRATNASICLGQQPNQHLKHSAHVKLTPCPGKVSALHWIGLEL